MTKQQTQIKIEKHTKVAKIYIWKNKQKGQKELGKKGMSTKTIFGNASYIHTNPHQLLKFKPHFQLRSIKNVPKTKKKQ